MNPTVPAQNNVARTTLNSAVNPNSYANRDYRMKASIQRDYETSIGLASLASTGYCPFLYQTCAGRVTINGVTYTTYNTDGCNSGYVYRKFVRNYGDQGRSEGDYAWPGINYKDTSRTGFQQSVHLENMFALARAYRKTGTAFYKNESIKRTLFSALDFWIVHDFICDNWWWNEMGTPNWMINTLLVMDDELTGKQRTEGIRIASRASLTGFGARAGGDFVPIAGMVVKQGLFKRDEAQVQHALGVMTA